MFKKNIAFSLLVLLLASSVVTTALAGSRVEYKIEIKNHKFLPETLKIPAGVKSKLIIINKDDTPEEFESFGLNREKVVPANGKIKVFLPPLKAGEYSFFGDFNPETARGKVIVK